MGDGMERRQFGRLNLLAHGRGRVCTVEYKGGAGKADLIDISAGGARIKCIPPCPGEEIRKVRLRVDNINDNGLLQRLEGEIRWRNGQECGIQFLPELEISLRTLQDLVG
ncbi:PilZ domain-containing protein [Humidesulfovibrio sp.]